VTTKTFLGIPVDGEITRGSDRKDQRPIAELQPILQAVLDDPTVTEFGWQQYTPYFNDGEPCEFGVSGLWVRTTDLPSTDEDEDADEDTYRLEVYRHPALGKRPRTWNPTTRDYDEAAYEGPDEARYDRCRALAKAIEGGEFENVLLDAFGDHARVTVRKTGIEIEFYDHD
jgi:hypothetical protein